MVDQFPLISACRVGDAQLVRTLLKDPGVNVNAFTPGVTGEDALKVCCQLGRIDLVQILLDDPRLEIDPDTLTAQTPFHLEITLLLLSDQRAGRLVRSLDHGQLIKAVYHSGTRAQLWRLLEVSGLNLNCLCFDQGTLFHQACFMEDKELISFLLALPGSDLNRHTRFGKTALFNVCARGEAPGLIRVLSWHPRINPNKPNRSHGVTPLYQLASAGDLEGLKNLLSSGRITNPEARAGRFSRTPIEAATLGGHHEVVALLRRYLDDPQKTSRELALGLLDTSAAEGFALIIFFTDGFLTFRSGQ